ncbi:MAG: nucleotidyltransferase domain-containing protein [Fimbriimonadaceae bacterium]|nr:nucleotidyltransferase domain-containing protein [Fimbriimonadaceae bacterium]
MLDRTTMIDRLKAALTPSDRFRAAWLGGSDATGRADERSDIDLMVVVQDGQVEAAVEQVENAIRELSPIRVSYRMPMPNWHGFHQAFYQLEKAPEDLMIDWLMMEVGQVHPWFEVERHGTPVVLFDKDGLISEAHVDRKAIDETIQKKVRDIITKYRLFRHLPVKCAERGLPLDAIGFYQPMIVRPLVDLARSLHCPERHDYGLRYLRDDLPADLYQRLALIAYPATVEQIPFLAREANLLFDELAARCGA